MKLNKQEYPFYDKAELDRAQKGYQDVLFNPGRSLQQRELTELGTYQYERLKSFVREQFGGNQILSGATLSSINSQTKQITFSGAKILYDADFYTVEPATLSYVGSGEEVFSLELKEQIITEIEDESLNDPTEGYDNYNQPGAFRIKRWVEYVKNTTDTNALKVLVMVDGVITFQRNESTPSKETKVQNESDIMALIEQRTFEESGNYIASGCRLFNKPCMDNNKIGFFLESGTVYIEGRRIDVLPQDLFIKKSSLIENIVGESHTSKSISDPIYVLKESPVIKINTVYIPISSSGPITRGSTNLDPIGSNLNILDIKQVYVDINDPFEKNVHYKQNGNFIEWLVAPPEAPAVGSTYTVEYVYNKINGQENVDYELFLGLPSNDKTLATTMPSNGKISIPLDDEIGNIIIKSVKVNGTKLNNYQYMIEQNKLTIPFLTNNQIIRNSFIKSSNASDVFPVDATINRILYYSPTQLNPYIEGLQYVLNGQNITFLDSGKMNQNDSYLVEYQLNSPINATTGDSVEIIYAYESQSQSQDWNSRIESVLKILNPNLAEGYNIFVNYSYVPTQHYYITVNKDGKINSKFKSSKIKDLIISSNELLIADIYAKYYSVSPIIQLQKILNVSMGELRLLKTEMENLKYDIQLSDLEKLIESTEPASSLKGVYTDGFITDSKIDDGYLSIKLGSNYQKRRLVPNIPKKLLNLNFTMTDTILSPDWNNLKTTAGKFDKMVLIAQTYNNDLWKSQPLASNYRSLAEGALWEVLPKVKISPDSDMFMDKESLEKQSIVSKIDYTLANAGAAPAFNNSIVPVVNNGTVGAGAQSTSSISGDYQTTVTKWYEKKTSETSQNLGDFVKSIEVEMNLRQIEIKVSGEDFPSDQDYIELFFDGIRCPLSVDPLSLVGEPSLLLDGAFKANSEGKFSAVFTIPSNIRYGNRKVELVAPGLKTETTFWGMGLKQQVQELTYNQSITNWELQQKTVSTQICSCRTYCSCNGRTPCSCNGHVPPSCSCDTRTSCSCNTRTSCSCNTRTPIVVCGCKTQTVIDCACKVRTPCSCNARTPCSCQARTPCACNTRQTCSCVSRGCDGRGGGNRDGGGCGGTTPIGQTFVVNMEDTRTFSPIQQKLIDLPLKSNIFVSAVDLCFHRPGTIDPMFVMFSPLGDQGLPLYFDQSNPNYEEFSYTEILNSNAYSDIADKWFNKKFSTPMSLNGNSRYAMILGSHDIDCKHWVAKLGEKNVKTNEIITTEPDRGVFIAAPNGDTWQTDVQTDLTHQIYIADFSVDPKIELHELNNTTVYRSYLYYPTVIFGDVENSTCQKANFILPRIQGEESTDGLAYLRYEYSINGGQTWIEFIPESLIEFDDAVSNVQFRVIFESMNKYGSPMLTNPNLFLSFGRYEKDGFYVSRSSKIGEYKYVNTYLDKFNDPSLSTIDIYYSPDNGYSWRSMPQMKSEMLWVDYQKEAYQVYCETKNKLIDPEILSHNISGVGSLTGNKYYSIVYHTLNDGRTLASNKYQVSGLSNNKVDLSIKFDPNSSYFKIYRSNTIDGDYHLIYNSGVMTTLTNNVLSTDNVLPVNSTVEFPESGFLIINNEFISYSGKTLNSFTGCVRGQTDLNQFVTVASNHNLGNSVILMSYPSTDLPLCSDVQGASGKIPDDFEVFGTLPNIYCKMVFTDKGLNDLTPVLVAETVVPENDEAVFDSSFLKMMIHMKIDGATENEIQSNLDNSKSWPQCGRLMVSAKMID